MRPFNFGLDVHVVKPQVRAPIGDRFWRGAECQVTPPNGPVRWEVAAINRCLLVMRLARIDDENHAIGATEKDVPIFFKFLLFTNYHCCVK